jgi:hypothetical protein
MPTKIITVNVDQRPDNNKNEEHPLPPTGTIVIEEL